MIEKCKRFFIYLTLVMIMLTGTLFEVGCQDGTGTVSPTATLFTFVDTPRPVVTISVVSVPISTSQETVTIAALTPPTGLALLTSAASFSSTITFVPTDTPQLIPTLPPIEEWQTFTSSTYGFSFSYPPGWEPIELPNKVNLVYQGFYVSLRVWVKQDTEDVVILRSGVSAGNLVSSGTVNFLGQDIDKNILVYQDKDKAVLYNNAGEIEIEDLVFALSLEGTRSDYESIAIPDDIQLQADKIIETFKLEGVQ